MENPMRENEHDHTAKPTAEHIKEHHKNEWRLYVDGASRNNPGPSGAGIVLMKNGKTELKKGFFLGTKTNNEAEYLAVLLGIFFLKQHMHAHDAVIIISDSQLLIRQFKGEYRVKKPELQQLYNLAMKLLHQIQYECYHVLRQDNEAADEMANYGIDKKIQIPPAFIEIARDHGLSL
jgi:ribonuclease HI